jgi:uncharacterized SAM-binding protein YcdF (DUF218 family)
MTGRTARRGLFAFLGVFCLLAIFLYAASPLWMAWMGRNLVSPDPAAPADIAVLLAGDMYGERMAAAVSLVESKLVPRILVSGPQGIYGTWESDLAIDWAVRQGKPRDWFVPVRMDADSTVEEAKVLIPWLREHRMKRIIVVTSNFHTRRAGAIWRSMAKDIDVRVDAAPCRDFDPSRWWISRRGQKTFLLEWEKTIAWRLGI